MASQAPLLFSEAPTRQIATRKLCPWSAWAGVGEGTYIPQGGAWTPAPGRGAALPILPGAADRGVQSHPRPAIALSNQFRRR